MQMLMTMTHSFACVALFHTIRKNNEREERWIHFTLVAMVALVGLAQTFLGIKAE